MGGRILVTGATGNTGSVIADLLLARGVPFVAMARSAENRTKLAARGIEAIAGDFDDPASLRTALEGVEKAYLVSTPDETLIRREQAFIAAAREAGVQHIVKCSAYMADINSESPNLRSHAEIERSLAASGLAWTVIRPHGFMQTFTLFSWAMIERVGVISAPHDDGAMPLVDVRDVAAVAVKALLEPGHAGQCYDVTGPTALTMWDMAEVLGRVLGRPVSYINGSPRSLGLMMKILGVPATPAEHVIVISRWVREHRLEQVHPTLQALGIRPTSYEEFVRDLVAGRTGGGNSFKPPDTRLARLLGAVMPVMLRVRLAIGGRPRRPNGD
ncbi:SDR family oxidoreductase [Nannocystis sp.]|uniref:SDR family oxidoreductase n=1 Tax=Nannocystis sp. TaxID=1962667 RepID=UPI002428CC18|nr:SDR family oxidoreductase [Nannocystis sp.]MBK7825518.1 SDR family oxidoreductase [Nannocystis sp.]MBK9756765.1 SDR family oxidoreductase [Nannocystis sp.]